MILFLINTRKYLRVIHYFYVFISAMYANRNSSKIHLPAFDNLAFVEDGDTKKNGNIANNKNNSNIANVEKSFMNIKKANKLATKRQEDANNNTPHSYCDVLEDSTRENADESLKEQTKNIFTNPYFALLLINGAMFLFGSSVVFTHIIAYAESQGISPALGRAMVSLLGVASLVGKICLGLVSQQKQVNTVMLYIAAVFISGKSVLLIKIPRILSGFKI